MPTPKKPRPKRSEARPSALATVNPLAALEPVLLEGESRATYESLLARVTAAIGPKDIIEEFWVRDIADLEWEALRFRRLKAELLNASSGKGLKELIEPYIGPAEASKLAAGWYARRPPK